MRLQVMDAMCETAAVEAEALGGSTVYALRRLLTEFTSQLARLPAEPFERTHQPIAQSKVRSCSTLTFLPRRYSERSGIGRSGSLARGENMPLDSAHTVAACV
jgi:hypothetical protein